MIEFALLASAVLSILLGGLELGVMMWTQGTLQAVAGQTARCAAIGASSCATNTAAKQYAINQAAALLGSALVNSTAQVPNFTVSVTSVTTCGTGSATGNFKQVTIAASGWTGVILFPLSLAGKTETLTACFPT